MGKMFLNFVKRRIMCSFEWDRWRHGPRPEAEGPGPAEAGTAAGATRGVGAADACSLACDMRRDCDESHSRATRPSCPAVAVPLGAQACPPVGQAALRTREPALRRSTAVGDAI